MREVEVSTAVFRGIVTLIVWILQLVSSVRLSLPDWAVTVRYLLHRVASEG